MFGSRLMAWRRCRGFSQSILAEKARIARPYLSRLEQDKADPSLSLLRKLSSCLDISIGELIERDPPTRSLTRFELDRLARSALRPGTASAKEQPRARSLSRALREKRAAFGLYRPRGGAQRSTPDSLGVHALRKIRADLGESQWQALIRRIDKLAPFESGRP